MTAWETLDYRHSGDRTMAPLVVCSEMASIINSTLSISKDAIAITFLLMAWV